MKKTFFIIISLLFFPLPLLAKCSPLPGDQEASVAVGIGCMDPGQILIDYLIFGVKILAIFLFLFSVIELNSWKKSKKQINKIYAIKFLIASLVVIIFGIIIFFMQNIIIKLLFSQNL